MALRYLLPGQLRFMSDNGLDVLMISATGKELAEVLANEQCRHIPVPMTRKITPLRDLRCLLMLIRIFRKEKPDIVHTHTPKAGLLGMLAARFCNVKVRIHTVAGLPMMAERGFKYRLLKQIEKITYRAASQVWPNSNSLMRFIQEQKMCRASKLRVIAKGSTNGININRFNVDVLDKNILDKIKKEIQFDEKNSYLLCIGRLVKDKGIVELVSCFSRMQQKQNKLKLILAGEYEMDLDPLPAATMQEIESNAGIFHIHWTNLVEYYMHLANIFVFPSHREGFPNVLLQAGAMGLPIICSRISGNIDLVTDGQTGLLFEKANEQQLEDCLNRALADPEQLNNMATTLQQEIRENYRQENIWQNMLEAYKSLLH